MLNKNELRLKLRNDRKSFEKGRAFLEPGTVPEGFVTVLRASAIVATYVKSGSEADPTVLTALARRSGKTIALPRLADREAPLVFRIWKPDDPLEQAPFGFRQPAASAPPAAPDLILAPLVGFDRNLNRLGQGAGHYDRAFAALPDSLRIGIAWSIQEVEALPADPWDVRIDAVLTEKEWITGPHSRITR